MIDTFLYWGKTSIADIVLNTAANYISKKFLKLIKTFCLGSPGYIHKDQEYTTKKSLIRY